MKKQNSNWNGKAILDPKHADDLEQAAAVHEFKGGLSRQNAEAKAYKDYREDHHRQSAAHHLRGSKAAQGSGDMDEARKHHALYELHMNKLGLDPTKEPPNDIKAHMNAEDKKPAHKFKAHPGDSLVLEDVHNQVLEATKKSETETLRRIYSKAVELLQKAEEESPLPGGESHDPKDFDPQALARGVREEYEHTNDYKIARQIAMDHLASDEKYYD
jgi:hypothetical protein